MTDIAQLLAGNELFEGMTREQIEVLRECASEVSFDEGKIIFWEGSDADHFFLIRSGKIAVQMQKPEKGPIAIQTLGDGDVLGWSWLFPPHKWNFDAQAIEPTQAIRMDARCVRGKIEQDHELGYQLMLRFAQLMVDRLTATRMQLLDLYGKD